MNAAPDTSTPTAAVVIELDDYRPHEVGLVRCRACHYVAVSVILAAAIEAAKNYQECPRCGEFESAFMTVDEVAAWKNSP